MSIYKFINKFNDDEIGLSEYRLEPYLRQVKKDTEKFKKAVTGKKGRGKDFYDRMRATGDRAVIAAADSAERRDRAKKLRKIKKIKKAGAIGAGVAGAAGAAYGGYKLAQRLKKRKECKARFPNDSEKYKACLKS
jgi:hypothetical protein